MRFSGDYPLFRAGLLRPLPFRKNLKEAKDIFDDLPAVFPAQRALGMRLPNRNGLVDKLGGIRLHRKPYGAA